MHFIVHVPNTCTGTVGAFNYYSVNLMHLGRRVINSPCIFPSTSKNRIKAKLSLKGMQSLRDCIKSGKHTQWPL